jgi:hypothetical protein
LDLVCEVVLPDYLEDSDQQVHASLKCLDSAELRHVRRSVEVLDPASEVHDQRHPVVDVDLVGSDNGETLLKVV